MGRRRKTCDSSTQTELNIKLPVVLLKRVSSVRGQDNLATQESSEPSITIRNPSLPTAQNKPMISRAPRSYRFFAQPITNNEKANSTLVNRSEQDLTLPEITSKESYKRKLVNDHNMVIPRAMEQEKPEPDVSPGQNLGTILEDGESTRLEDDLATGFEVEEIVVETLEGLEESPNARPSTIQENGKIRENASDIDNDLPERDKKLDSKNHTTIVFSTPQSIRPRTSETNSGYSKNETKPNESSEHSSKENFQQKSEKTILIKANTVHIYNHFYGSG